MRTAYINAKEYDPSINQVTVSYKDEDQAICIANSEGLYTNDRRIRTRMGIMAVAGDGTENQTGFVGPGRSMGFELFDIIDPEYYAKEAARVAVTMLRAKPCPAGRMPVVIENGFGGVIFHEACGHSLEGASVAKGNSAFSGKLGQKIASEKVTAIDDGTIPNAWGSTNIDDEGMPMRKRMLIENGILREYMLDRLNAKIMNLQYRYPPGKVHR
jgi:TldD protein